MIDESKIRYWKTILVVAALFIAFGCSRRQSYSDIADRGQTIVQPNAININTATADELEKLPYIGRKTADSIVQFRTENGPFRRTEHLLQIRGISEKRFLELRQYLRTE